MPACRRHNTEHQNKKNSNRNKKKAFVLSVCQNNEHALLKLPTLFVDFLYISSFILIIFSLSHSHHLSLFTTKCNIFPLSAFLICIFLWDFFYSVFIELLVWIMRLMYYFWCCSYCASGFSLLFVCFIFYCCCHYWCWCCCDFDYCSTQFVRSLLYDMYLCFLFLYVGRYILKAYLANIHSPLTNVFMILILQCFHITLGNHC